MVYNIQEYRDTVPGHALILLSSRHSLIVQKLNYGNVMAGESMEIAVISERLPTEKGDDAYGIIGRCHTQCVAYRTSTLECLAISYAIKAVLSDKRK